MKRKVVLLGVFILCASLLLTGGKPKLIGEDEAKKAGLAFINQVFDGNETDATVELETHAGVRYIDGEYVATGEEQPVSTYVVSILEQKTGGYLYRAEVNAETGVAYYASRSSSLVPIMTPEQHQQFQNALPNGDWSKFDYLKLDKESKDFARDWITEKFDLDAKILGSTDGGSIVDNDGVQNSFYVVIRDGTIYYVNVAWPQLMVMDVAILNQTKPYEDEP
ncbi:MAG: hypothetical protein PHW41_09155 [Eubacteriales bacterium]|nr:hypothetical protein [Eubacteriales bacterium]